MLLAAELQENHGSAETMDAGSPRAATTGCPLSEILHVPMVI